MLYDEPGPIVTRHEPRYATCFANSGLQPTNCQQVRARPVPPGLTAGGGLKLLSRSTSPDASARFPPASPPGAD